MQYAAVFSNLYCLCVFIKLIVFGFCMSVYDVIGETTESDSGEIVSGYSTKYR